MSKSTAAKSKGEKGGKSAAAVPTPVTHDIVPGKFTDQDWVWMLDRDESHSFIVDLVDEIYTTADKVIYDNYIERQLVRYTVLQAKDAFLQIIEWQFLERDEGSCEKDASAWVRDNEPTASSIDCWAQGAVPLTSRPPPILEEQETSAHKKPLSSRCSPNAASSPVQIDGCTMETREVREDDICCPIQIEHQEKCSAPPATCDQECSGKSSPAKDTILTCGDKSEPVKPDAAKPKCDISCGAENQTADTKKTDKCGETDDQPKSNTEADSSRERRESLPCEEDSVPSAEVPCTTSVAPESNNDLEKPLSQEATECDVKCDHAEMNLFITKIPPSRLPSNRVKTVYCIVDPKHEANRVRTDALRLHKKPPCKNTTTNKICTGQSSSFAKAKFAETDVVNRQVQPVPRLPLLLDSMKISAGVTARERDLVKKGPKLISHKAEVESDRILHPVRSHNPHPTVDVSDVLDNHIYIKPVKELLPPIPRSSALTSQ